MLNRVLYVISVHDFVGGTIRPRRVRLSGHAISSGEPVAPQWFGAGDVVATGTYRGLKWAASIVAINQGETVTIKVTPNPFPGTIGAGGEIEITVDVDELTEEAKPAASVLEQALEVVEAAERTTSNV